ncbi:MAG: RHS repeat protein, partial [Betaproteobacteria bacterium]|nr:RHS repeat protein [Betaproteobacteria bacterium]
MIRLTDAGGLTTGWRLIAAAGDEIETYDVAGKLVSLTDRQGRTVTLAYDGSNRLATITDAYGHALTLAYDAQNRVTTLTQPDGGIVHFNYDTANNLAGITWPDTRTRSYHYENTSFPNNLTGITDENGTRYATYGYDSQGRAILTEHAGGAQRATLAFGGTSTTVTDVLGTARTHTLTTVLGVVRGGGQSQPGGSGCGPSSSAQSYDANGNVSSRTDFNGNVTTYSYDLTRNLETSRVEASGSTVARAISTQWHPVWRLPVKVAEPLKLTTSVYNGDSYSGTTVTCAPAGATVPSPSGVGTQPIGVLCRSIEQATTDA